VPIYTDYFDQPIAVGDEIVYPETSGTNRACFGRYPIVKIIPLVPHRLYPSSLMREDQMSRAHPTDYGTATMVAPDKRFIVQVQKENWRGEPRKFAIRFIDNIIKVP
jgi:hypothetical protein